MDPNDLVQKLAISPQALLEAQGDGAEMIMPFSMKCPLCGRTLKGHYVAVQGPEGPVIDEHNVTMDPANLHAPACPAAGSL